MNLMDITKKFATPEACVHFLEGIGWQSIADVESLLCQVDHRAVYFRQTAPKTHISPRFAAYTRLPSRKRLSTLNGQQRGQWVGLEGGSARIAAGRISGH
jgi:hypothetical protein